MAAAYSGVSGALFGRRSIFIFTMFFLFTVYIRIYNFTDISTIRSPKYGNGIYRSNVQEDWQDVGSPHYRFWIYSAYAFEDNHVIIIGTPFPFKKGQKPEIYCNFHTTGGEGSLEKTTAKIERMRGWDPRWAGTFVRCPLPNSGNILKPTSVSVLLGNQTESPARLKIQCRVLHTNNFQSKFSVCVLPLYGYNQVFHFLEWVEFYRMMGVDQFTFYNRSVGPATSCVMNNLENYSSELKVYVNPWHKYPQRKDADIRYGVGLSAGTNACLYSHKGISNYMIFVDVDEFIVPLDGIRNYDKLIEHLGNITAGGQIGEYLFQNGFYLKDRAKDPELLKRCSSASKSVSEFLVCQQLWTVGYYQREPLRNWGRRSKYMVQPEGVRNGGNHYALEFEKGWKSLKVPGDVAFSRHYRRFSKENTSFVEKIPIEMGTVLANNVVRSLEYFAKVCSFSMVDIFQE